MTRATRTIIAVVALAAASSGPGSLNASAAPTLTTTTFEPVADAYVDASRPRANFGTAEVLRGDTRPVEKAYLRFSVVLDAPVSSATLRVFARRADAGLRVAPVNKQTWGETTITYRNAPSPGAVIAATTGGDAGTWRSVDVTSRVRTGGLVSFALLAKNTDGFALGSRESARSPRLVVRHGTEPPQSPPPVRGLFRDGDIDLATVASLGFNTVTVNPYPEDLDALSAASLEGLVWLGGYDSDLCQFRRADEWIRERLEEVGSHPAIHAFFIDDEPHADCPNVRQQMIARSDLVESLVPGAITVLTENRAEDFDELANTTDVLGIIVYPCSHPNGCVFSKIDDRVAQAEAAGVAHYWGTPQSFGDEYYRVPSPQEQAEIFDRWNATRMEGYLGYAWASDSDPETLDTHTELWDAWMTQNANSLLTSPSSSASTTSTLTDPASR